MGLALMILLWGGLVVVAVWLVRTLFPLARQSVKGEQKAGTILDWRYARGEISREEYNLMKETLSHGGE